MNELKTQLLRWIDADKDRLVDFYRGFVRAKSPNPPGDTRAALDHVAAFMRANDLPYRTVAPQEHMPNIVATLQGAHAGPHLVLNGHADVFPVGREDLWERDPWSGDLEDGRIFGRGSSDMKGGSTAAIFAFAYLHRMRAQLRGKLTLMIVSDEETGGRWGSQYLLEHLGAEALGDCVLSGEPGGVGTVRYGEKGILQFTVSVKTRGAHGPYPHLSPNAIRVASSIMDQLERLQDMKAVLPKPVADNLDSPVTRRVIEATMGEGTADIMRCLTVNVGTIRGGTKVNMVAADCTMEVDIRVPIGIDRDQVLDAARKIVAAHAGRNARLGRRQRCQLLRSGARDGPDHPRQRQRGRPAGAGRDPFRRRFRLPPLARARHPGLRLRHDAAQHRRAERIHEHRRLHAGRAGPHALGVRLPDVAIMKVADSTTLVLPFSGEEFAGRVGEDAQVDATARDRGTAGGGAAQLLLPDRLSVGPVALVDDLHPAARR